jgi:hypothetical protein
MARRTTARPLSITLIGGSWILDAFAQLTDLGAVFNQSTVFFGLRFTGLGAILFLLGQCALGFYLGFGLFRLSELARKVTLGVLVFDLTFYFYNFLQLLWARGQLEFETALLNLYSSIDPARTGASWVNMILAFEVGMIVIFSTQIGFLIRHKSAFVKTPSSATPY